MEKKLKLESVRENKKYLLTMFIVEVWNIVVKGEGKIIHLHDHSKKRKQREIKITLIELVEIRFFGTMTETANKSTFILNNKNKIWYLF